MFIDSHAHLDMLKDPKEALARAHAAGVRQVVTIGIDLASSKKAAALARAHKTVFCTIGLHPHDAAQADEAYWDELKRLAVDGGAKAVGECGLDYFRNYSPVEAQREVFARQIELARELGLPLVIHDRDAHQEVLDTLRELRAGELGGVVHCFSGDMEVARQVLGLGFHLGVTGVVTYPKNSAFRELLTVVPLERLLIETDCPFLSPQPKRGKPNEPAYLPMVAEGLAQALGRPLAEVAQATTANARRLFGLPEA